MGEFYYSSASGAGIRQVEAMARSIASELWGSKYRVERCKLVPTTAADSRKARWLFWNTTPEWAQSRDCAFTFSLEKGGRMEFKVPRSTWDESWEDQQKLRRRLVLRLKAVSQA
jgi:hypothetical protein